MESDDESHNSPQGRHPGLHGVVPKRGAKACTACRKGKNRCVNNDGKAPCKRCEATGASCVFEQNHSKTFDEERMDRLERSVGGLTTTIEGLLSVFRTTGIPSVQPSYTPQSFPNPSNSIPTGYNPAPLLPQQPHAATPSSSSSNGGPLRLDADFNARSPSNPLHWEMGVVPNGNLGQILAESRNLYPQEPQPPVMPPMLPALAFGSSSPGDHKDAFSMAPIPPPPTASHPGSAQKRQRSSIDVGDGRPRRPHPPLPNYRAPPHPISQYGIVQSNVPSDDEDALPTSSLTAPFEALAEAAAAAASGTATPVTKGRSHKRRKRRMPPPPNAFPDVVEKGLVSDAIARQIFSFYFSHCHKFFPILDPSTIDTYEGMRYRTPWSIDSVLSAAAARMPDPSPEIQEAAEHALEEAQGIARSSLFGPTVRKEGVQAMALAAAWADNPYCAAGHALRMGFELGLHRALGKLVQGPTTTAARIRQDEEEQELVVASRIFLCLLWLDWTVSSGSGRPHLYDKELVSPDKLHQMLRHPLSTDSDLLLVAHIELVACRTRIDQGFKTTTDSHVIDFVRSATRDLQTWWKTWDGKLSTKFSEESFERKSLLCAYHAGSTILATTALKGQNMDGQNLSSEARELAMTARQSASDILDLWLNTVALSSSLRYATQSTFVDVTFSALLLLKLARLFPDGAGQLSQVVNQGAQLQALLHVIPRAERFHMTLRLALERFSKVFHVSLPRNPSLTLSSESLSGDFGIGLQQYQALDVGSLPLFADDSWSATVPDWLSDPLAWTFESMDMSQGLDKIFLPPWSMDSFGSDEW